MNRKTTSLFRMALLLVLVIPITALAQGTYEFADLEWVIRSWDGGPPEGGNFWIGQEGTAVDFRNQTQRGEYDDVTLGLYYQNGQWYSAEINAIEDVEYGRYCFYVDGILDQLHPDVVFGMFLYDNMNDRDDDTYREIDIEFSNNSTFWGQRNPSQNAHFAVQRGGVEALRSNDARTYHKRFDMDFNGSYSTHCIDWQRDSVSFYSYHGHTDSIPDNLEEDWTYNRRSAGFNPDLIPREGSTTLIVNFWVATPYTPDILPNTSSQDGILSVTIMDITHPN